MKKSSQDSSKSTKQKQKYKIRNWSEYNEALIQRGSLRIWIREDIEGWWYGEGKKKYSDQCIETILMVKALYQLPLRATIGVVRSIFTHAGIMVAVPDYSTVSRRAQSLSITLKKRKRLVTDLIVDSTGAKMYGEGEWKVRKHGWSKRRTWKKIHLGIDSAGEIRAVEMTSSDAHDAPVLDALLAQEDAQITDFYGDGAYDTNGVYWALRNRDVRGFHIPPQKNAKIKVHGNRKLPPWPRDENLRAIRKTSRTRWKQTSGYHIRSLGENAMFRFKTIFGGHLSFRTNNAQKNEVITKANLLNAFYSLGMPLSVPVS